MNLLSFVNPWMHMNTSAQEGNIPLLFSKARISQCVWPPTSMTKTKVILSGTWLGSSGSFSGSHKGFRGSHLGDIMEHFVLVSPQVHSQSLSSVTPEASQRPYRWIGQSMEVGKPQLRCAFLVVFPLAPKISTTKHTIFSGTSFYNMVQWCPMVPHFWLHAWPLRKVMVTLPSPFKWALDAVPSQSWWHILCLQTARVKSS